MIHHLFDLSSKLSIFIFFTGLIFGILFRKRKFIFAIPLTILIILFAWLSTIQASNDLEWLDEVSLLPKIHIDKNNVKIENFRNFIWQSDSDSNLNWEVQKFDLSKLDGLYLVVVPFGNSDYMAHTMLVFTFTDRKNIAISVETRKEKDEDYSLIAGALRQLELIYIFGSAQDLLSLRAVHRKANIHFYPIKADHAFTVSLFKSLAVSANTLHEQPKFYRTLRDNCTSTLVKHIDQYYQNQIGTRLETIFPAKSGRLLYELDRMDTQLSYEQVHAISRVDDFIRENALAENFPVLFEQYLAQLFVTH